VDEVLPTALELAEKLCQNGPLAMRTAKEIAVRAWNHEAGFVLENLLFQRVRESEDAKEGPRAYMENRKPVFKGR
jgi:enoyl-CoA hydratase